MQYSEGLKKNRDFSLVYDKGYSRVQGPLVMYVRKNEASGNRIGVVVSKKVGNSVIRHRIKRLVKESYRLREASYKKGYDLVIVARKTAAGADFHQIDKAMAALSESCHVALSENESHKKNND